MQKNNSNAGVITVAESVDRPEERGIVKLGKDGQPIGYVDVQKQEQPVIRKVLSPSSSAHRLGLFRMSVTSAVRLQMLMRQLGF